MKKVLVSLMLFLFLTVTVSAQNDKMFFHSGKDANVKIVKVEEFTIVYKYAGEDAEQTISKVAVAKIKYASGREENISDKVVINGKGDWEKVTLLLDKSQIVGLKKGGEIQGKTMGFFSGYVSAAGADKRSLKKLYEAAAELNCPFVYMTVDKDAKSGNQHGSYGAQGNKRGIAYNYEQ